MILVAACGGAGFSTGGLPGTDGGSSEGSVDASSSGGGGTPIGGSSSGGVDGDVAPASPAETGGDADAQATLDAHSSSEEPEAGLSSASGGPRPNADASRSDGASADGGSDAPTSPDGSSFEPGSVSGLALWLDAAKGVDQAGGAVSAWLDRTGHHNDASQATVAEQPSLHAGAVNGLPAIHFNNVAGGTTAGDMMVIADSASLQWGTGDFYLVFVALFDNTLTNGPESGVGLLYSKTGIGANVPGPMLTANIVGALSSNQVGLAGSTSSASGDAVLTHTAYNDGTPHAFALQRRGTLLDLRVDGASVATSVSSDADVSGPGTPVRIGGDANGQAIRLDGDVAEVIAIAGTLSAADRTSLEAYLASKYAL